MSTYVPFRNGLFLSSAASMALSLGCSVVYYGAHHDDWAGNAYPDCSLEFVEAMNRAIVEGTGGELRLEAPFVTWSKADIVREGLALGVPYELTWSCYEGGALRPLRHLSRPRRRLRRQRRRRPGVGVALCLWRSGFCGKVCLPKKGTPQRSAPW